MLLRLVIYACFILSCVCVNFSIAQNPSSPNKESTVEERIQHIQNALLPAVLVEGEPATTNLADRMSELKVPGVSIAVIHDGEIEWARGFGVTKIGGPPVTADTLFQAASISKPVSAMAALHLVESGKLNLDVDVNQYLRSWRIPVNNFTEQSKVTLRRLLSHTAGTTIHGFPGYPSGEPVPTLVQVLNGEKPSYTLSIVVDTEPGKTWRYSGGGYVVMQQLLEDVTGQPFPKLMQDTVLKPIGMKHSTYEQPLPPARLAEAALPYGQNGQAIKGGPHIYPEMTAAGLWTTPSDLARYAIEIQKSLSGKSSRIISARMVREMLTPVTNDYGLGLSIGGKEGHLYFTHDGSNAGFQSLLTAYNRGDGAVIMTNGDNGSVLANEIMRTIAREYGWPDLQPPVRKQIALAPKVLEQYVGTYRLQPEMDLVITLESGHLLAQATGNAKTPLYAESETRFFPKVTDAQIEFLKDDKGRVTHAIVNMGGTVIKAPRK